MTIDDLKKLLAAIAPGPYMAEGAGKTFRLMRDLKAQGKHWDQDDEALRNGGWVPFDASYEKHARCLAALLNAAPKLIALAEAVKAVEDTVIDETLSEHNQLMEGIRSALSALESP